MHAAPALGRPYGGCWEYNDEPDTGPSDMVPDFLFPALGLAGPLVGMVWPMSLLYLLWRCPSEKGIFELSLIPNTGSSALFHHKSHFLV